MYYLHIYPRPEKRYYVVIISAYIVRGGNAMQRIEGEKEGEKESESRWKWTYRLDGGAAPGGWRMTMTDWLRPHRMCGLAV